MPLASVTLQSDPVVIRAGDKKGVTSEVVKPIDEKGTVITKKPSLISLYFGNRFMLENKSIPLDLSSNPTAQTAATSFAGTNMLRSDEAIYKGSGATLAEAGSAFVPEPTLRIEYEIPFQGAQWLSTHFSLESAFTGTRSLVTSTGNFRYQNAQANHVALTDVTYTGTLTASDVRYNLTPMVGMGVELTNPTLSRASDLRFLIRLAGGVSLQSGKRSYELSVAPQYIAAGSYSDTYSIKSSMTQSYQMAFFAAGRLELGARIRLGSTSTHLTLMGSVTMLYGNLPFDNYGYFTEQAGAKTTYQKITASISDESYLGIAPAIFLALSREL